MKFNLRKFDQNSLGGVLVHMAIALGILVFLSLFYFYAYLPHTTNHGESITVPGLEKMKLSELESFLSNKHLRYEVSDSGYAADQAPLTVIKQYPHEGAKVKEGRVIFISINRLNPPTVPVPDLIDGSVVNAEAVLRSNQLKRGRIETVPGPFNIVKEMKYRGQKITEGTRVPKGAVIDLVVMNNSGPQKMPDLANMPYDEAKILIRNYDLILGNVEGDTTVTENVVIQQKPQPGQNTLPGDVVDIWMGLPGEVPDSDL